MLRRPSVKITRLPVRIPAALMLLVCGIITISVMTACAAPAAEEQDKNWTGVEDLVRTSDRVLLAEFLESRLETIEDPFTDSSGQTEVLFRQFRVFETLKGTSESGDTLWVAFEPGMQGELVNGRGEVADFTAGTTYVLFLKGRLRPEEYPTEFGPVLWTGNGEPSFAELVGDELLFRAERAYLDLLINEGHTLPDPRSAAPFRASLDEARGLAG